MVPKISLYIYGCGVTAKSVYAYFKDHPQYLIDGFVVDEEFYRERRVCGLPLLSFQRLTETDKSNHSFIVCIGYSNLNKNREKIYENLVADGCKIISLYDSSYEDLNIDVGDGSIIMPGASIQPFTSIGRSVIVWPGAIVGHDTVIGDFCWLTAGSAIGGNSTIGDYTFVGIQSVVADGVRIGKSNLIGGGVYVSKCSNDNEAFLQESAGVARMGAQQFVKFTRFGE